MGEWKWEAAGSDGWGGELEWDCEAGWEWIRGEMVNDIKV
jgi:hypothetical protein